MRIIYLRIEDRKRKKKRDWVLLLELSLEEYCTYVYVLNRHSHFHCGLATHSHTRCSDMGGQFFFLGNAQRLMLIAQQSMADRSNGGLHPLPTLFILLVNFTRFSFLIAMLVTQAKLSSPCLGISTPIQQQHLYIQSAQATPPNLPTL